MQIKATFDPTQFTLSVEQCDADPRRSLSDAQPSRRNHGGQRGKSRGSGCRVGRPHCGRDIRAGHPIARWPLRASRRYRRHVRRRNQKSASNARDLIAAFDDVCARQVAMRRGTMYEHLLEHCTPNEVARILVDHARLRDLAIFPVNPEDPGQRSLVEALIFESGRPVLLLPETTTRQLPLSFDRAAVAWDHSRPAARAIADALPMLQAAKHVHVVTVVDEKHLRKPHSGVELCTHLARHGVEVTFDKTPAEGRTIGEVLEGYAIERDIDLLVMGAYGHSRLREFILGGATKRVLTHPFTWTLVSH
jgi:nucleotide-binding universal stress UspA family protein